MKRRSILAAGLATAAAVAAPSTASKRMNCKTPPLGETALYLRGTMNNWTAQDDFEFQWDCDSYALNVSLQGRQEFKIADAAWGDKTSFGESGGNFVREFGGEHTLRLSFDALGHPQLAIGPRTFVDPTQQPVTDALALALKHDSRNEQHKSPFGAVAAGTTVSFAIEGPAAIESLTLVIEERRLEGNQDLLEYHELARVPLQAANGRWSARHAFAEPGVYGYWFEASIGGERYAYQNNRDTIYWTREKGSNGLGVVEAMPAARHRIRRLRLTVHAADYRVPSWAQDAIYYYIFPERFRNGDRRNDPKPGIDRYQDHDVELHANWLDRPYRPGSGDGSDEVYNNDFFGGDLAGIIDKLDYIAELGANTIYMTPVFTAASNHKYDTADYRNIDPHFGSNEDFTRLCREAAKRGIRVIPDASLNHTGADSIYFDRFGHYGQHGAFEDGVIRPASPYAGWYRFDPTQKDPDKQFKGWVGVSDLPELNKASPDFRRFAYGAPDSVMKLWLDRGASGWRMDVAPWVPDDFWREWRTAIKAHKPDTLTIAETWFEASKFFLGDTFDSTMNYVFRNAVLDYAGGGSAQKLAQNLELMRELYPRQSFHALMNLLSTHDAARSLHVLGWKSEGDDAATIALAKRRFRLAVFFQMTYPGAPAIYYGDEVGVTGGEDPYNRATYPWEDLGGRPDKALLAQFKRLTMFRRKHAVLRRGELLAPLHVDEHVLVLARRLDKRWAITAVNNADSSASVSIQLPHDAPRRFREAVDASGRLTVSIPACSGVALLSD
jgi:glycosidase